MPHLKKIKRPWQQNNKPKAGWTKEGNEFYHTSEWRKLRKQKLNQTPYCEYCKAEDKRIVEATVADHLRPVRLYPELRLDINNIRSSCKHHHYSKNTKSRVYSREAFERVLQDEGWK